MRNDNRAIIYVLGLGRDQVTSRQKQVLFRIAEHYSDRFALAIVSNEELADELLYSPRHLRRVLAQLAAIGILGYKPGLGVGNFSQFRFPLMAVENEPSKGTQSGHKADISAHAIKEENLNLFQSQKIPQTPSASAGESRSLTSRQLKELREAVHFYSRQRRDLGQPIVFREIVEASCANLLIPLDKAWEAIAASGMGDGRKLPQSCVKTRAG